MHFFDSFIISKNVKACKKIQNIFLNSQILEAENCVLLLCLEMRDAGGILKGDILLEFWSWRDNMELNFGVLILERQHGVGISSRFFRCPA